MRGQHAQQERMMQLRRLVSKKRPRFHRTEWWRMKRVGSKWRRPRGIDNHLAHHFIGYGEVARVGYRGPRKARGLHPSGYREVLVNNLEDLNRLVPRKDAVKVGGRVGLKKRLDIVRRATELGLHVINPGRAKVES